MGGHHPLREARTNSRVGSLVFRMGNGFGVTLSKRRFVHVDAVKKWVGILAAVGGAAMRSARTTSLAQSTTIPLGYESAISPTV